MENLSRYNKFIVAMLAAGVVVLTPFFPSVAETATEEWIQSAAVLIGAVLVYTVPNKDENGVNVNDK